MIARKFLGLIRCPKTSKKVKLPIGHTNLPAHKSKLATNVSPLCEVCQIKSDISHLFYKCVKFNTYRLALLQDVSLLLRAEHQVDDTPNLKTLLGFNLSLSEITTKEIASKVAHFLAQIDSGI